MKTSVNMLRKMGSFNIVQRTQDSYFNANDLLLQWNKKNSKRDMKRFLDSPKTATFINEIQQGAEMRDGENQVVITKKGRNTKKGKTPAQVWMHPYLFIDFAMWINPKFKLEVIKFVYDQLIEYRHSAGDMYRGLTNAMSIFPNVNYVQVAKALNWIVFNKHEPKIRNSATQEELNELVDIQKKLAFAVDMNYIKTYEGLVIEMRRIYHIKHNTIRL